MPNINYSTDSIEEITIFKIRINSNETMYYRVYLWLDNASGEQNEIQNSFLDVELNAVLNLEANSPILDDGMIPVVINNDGTVTTVSENDKNWYNYSGKKWANVVLVNDEATDGVDGSQPRSYYKDNVGVEVLSSDILAYYVWVPRYRYKIWTTALSSSGNEQEIDIVFESENETIVSGTTVGSYRTHPAFLWDVNSDGNIVTHEVLPGIWVGKFETTGTVDKLTILDNQVPLNSQMTNTFFQRSLMFVGGLLDSTTGDVYFNGNNIYGLSNNIDSHMMKNSEWGAVAYLSHSKYGINNNIRKNNYFNNGPLTGCGASTDGAEESTTCDISYGGATSYPQSTTGNITGIFDMSGGLSETMMSNYNDTIELSEFSVLPESKYYDKYTTDNVLTACNGGICYGYATSETMGWYGGTTYVVNATYPFNRRGSSYDVTSANVFSNDRTSGTSSSKNGMRSVLNNYGYIVDKDDRKSVTYNYNINYSFTSEEYMDTGHILDWDNDFRIEIGFNVPTSGLRYLLIGNYNKNDKNAFSVEVNADNKLRIRFGPSTARYEQILDEVAIGEDIILTFDWDASREKFEVTAIGSTTDIYFSSCFGMHGKSAYSLRIGTVDQRGTSGTFNPIEVYNLSILVPYTSNSVLSSFPTNPTSSAFTFSNWTNSSGTIVSGATTINQTTDFVLNANWSGLLNYTVLYDANGGSGAPSKQTKVHGKTLVLSSTKPTKTGYTFVKWEDNVGDEYQPGDDYTHNNGTTLTAVWRINQVIIKYHVNGGTITSSTTSTSGTTYSWTTSSSLVYKDGKLLTQKINYGESGNLNNYNNSGYIQIKKTGYTTDDGKEWICSSGCTTANKTFDQSVDYTSDNFCDASNGDCTVTVKVNWRVSQVIIKYHVNGGTITSSTTSTSGNTYSWTTSSSLIYRNGSLFTQKINHGESGDLNNYNNSNYIEIKKSGYTAVDGKEWICSSGCTTANKTFDHAADYTSDEFCDTSNGDCTVVLKVNWEITTQYLYKEGSTYSSVTGGWQDAFESGEYYNTKGTLTMNTSSMKLSADCYKCIIFARTKNKINISNYSTLKVVTTGANGSSSYGHFRYFGLCDGSSWNSTSGMVKYASLGTETSTGTYTLDISSKTGSYYVCALAGGVASWVNISKVYLK